MPCLCTIQPLKSGHLTNQDTFFCPKGVRIREVPLQCLGMSFVTVSFTTARGITCACAFLVNEKEIQLVCRGMILSHLLHIVVHTILELFKKQGYSK